MSYILNALKQSESQRNLGEIPHIDTAQEPSSPYRPAQRRGIDRGWAMLAGLLPLLAVGWVMMNRQPDPPADPPAPPATLAPSPPPPAAAPVPEAAPADSQAPGLAQLQGMVGTPIQLDDRAPPTRPAAPVVLELPVAVGRVTPPQAAASREQRVPPPIPQRGAEEAGQEEGAQLSGVSHWKGLPSGIQRQVRELGINAHVYSTDSSARFIRAKGRSLREGDSLTDELRLQRITSDGIVFTYQGTPYWMRLN